MVPAWAAPSLTYSMVRASFWNRLAASSRVLDGSSPAVTVLAICRRSETWRCSAT